MKDKLIQVIIMAVVSIIWGLFHIANYPNITLLNFFIMCLEFFGFSILILILNNLLINHDKR